MPPLRKDRVGEFRTALDKNKKIIFQTQQICGICGQPVDMSLKYPDPMSKTVDHIIPIAKGGHPSDLSNLQLAHRWCNRQKSDKLFATGFQKNLGVQNNPPPSNLPGVDSIQKYGSRWTDSGEPDTETQEPRKAMASRTPAVDNNNLPQHADWSSFTW